MRLIGLTGGIASGKSTVSQMLRALGACVVDADALAREVVEPGTPALAEIARRFPGTVDASGRLDRGKLAERIFHSPEERMELNAIVHPRIQALLAERLGELERRGIRLAFYDAALLIENGLQKDMDGVLLVTAPPEVQIARLVARDGLTEEAARARLAAQLPLAEKLRHATWVVDNTGDLASTRAQVERIWRAIQSSA